MTLMLSQGHMVMGKLDAFAVILLKSVWSILGVSDGWLCKGDGCEEVPYGEYGSFEHLLFFVSFFFFSSSSSSSFFLFLESVPDHQNGVQGF